MRPGLLRFVLFLIACSAWAQDQSPGIRIQIVEGEGAINSIRLHRAHDPVVRLIDGAGEPIANVPVTFVLPGSGPSGTFGESGLSLTSFTDARGTAVGRGLRPNTVSGQFRIRVSALWHGSPASAGLMQTNAEPVAKAGHSKKIAIIAVIAGAAVGGTAMAARGGKGGTTQDATTGATSGGSIAAGPPSVGPPH